jgi:hypothetical protein
MDDYFINAQESYDRVSQEYADRIFNELEHKPLDRELLDPYTGFEYESHRVCILARKPNAANKLA